MLHVITVEKERAELELMLGSLESSEISIIQLVTELPTISSSNVSTVLFFSLKLKIHGMLTNVQNARKTHRKYAHFSRTRASHCAEKMSEIIEKLLIL